MKSLSRRQLMSSGIKITSGLIATTIGSRWLGLSSFAFATDKPLLTMEGKDAPPAVLKARSIAKGLGYVENADKAEKDGKIKRKEKVVPKTKLIKAADQQCDNCQFYTKVDGKKGGCTLIQGVTVAAEAWCNTWTPKMPSK